jgi:hypothetical protein
VAESKAVDTREELAEVGVASVEEHLGETKKTKKIKKKKKKNKAVPMKKEEASIMGWLRSRHQGPLKRRSKEQDVKKEEPSWNFAWQSLRPLLFNNEIPTSQILLNQSPTAPLSSEDDVLYSVLQAALDSDDPLGHLRKAGFNWRVVREILKAEEQKTTSHRACWRGDFAAAEAALRSPDAGDARDAGGRTPLHLLCEGSRPHFSASRYKILNLLNCDVNARDQRGNTPLHYACRSLDSLMVKKLVVERNADLLAVNRKGVLPCETHVGAFALVSCASPAQLEALKVRLACARFVRDTVKLACARSGPHRSYAYVLFTEKKGSSNTRSGGGAHRR